MNRPARRNALSRGLVAALHRAVQEAAAIDGVRVVVLGGEGPAFCAGADIGEFASSTEDGLARSDAEGIVGLLGAMASSPLPIVAKVHGAAFGGALGLICAADIVVAADDARFALSEARLGLVAAVIAPYVYAALGNREARARILRAAPFDAETALRIGLVHEVAPAGDLDAAVEAVVADLLRGAPGALATIKRLPEILGKSPTVIRNATVDLLAERLASEEGREGLAAFLEKRSPAWTVTGGAES
jgi:methylglutaconyl-CoA hydratase